MRRFFDIFFSALAMLVLLVFMIPVMVILKCTGEHYIFYGQARMGKNRKEFKLLKFATMLKDSPALGTGDITVRNDPRVLPFGHFLRKSKINELPQLINIFVGHMSIVGPRPLTPRNFGLYSEDQQQVIAAMRPGLTGIGSLIFRDEEGLIENNKGEMDHRQFYASVISPYKAELERWYASRQGIGTYWKLIFATALAVLNPRSRFYLQWFPDLPEPPVQLASLKT